MKAGPAGEAYSIMSMAMLKVIKPSVTAMRMSTHYNRTFVCMDRTDWLHKLNVIGIQDRYIAAALDPCFI